MDERTEKILFVCLSAVIITATLMILLSDFASSLKINEIMFNPNGFDSGREWIEIYDNQSCYDLTAYKLFQSSNHYIYSYNNKTSCDYSIICSNCETFLNENGIVLNQTIAIYKSSFTLSNSGEYIALKLNDSAIDEINYANFTNISEGYSLEFYNNSWRQSLNFSGSPGLENIFIINETINITANITTNETINITSNETINMTNYCNISISITLKNSSIDVFNNKESLKFYNKIEDNNYEGEYYYSIEYWIEDLFENIIKNKATTTNQNEKSYTPSIDERDQILIIKNKLTVNNCTNIGTEEYSKFVLVKNNYYTEESNEQTNSSCTQTSSSDYEKISSISITKTDITKNKLSSAIYIYKGNTRKSVIDIAIIDENDKDIETFKLKLNEKYSSMNFEFEKEFDCSKNSTYYFIAEGLDVSLKEKLNISCPETLDKTTQNKTTTSKITSTTQLSTSNSQKTSEQNYSAESASQATGQAVYESPNQKNKLYSFIGLVLLCLAGISFLGYKVYKGFRKNNENNNTKDKNEGNKNIKSSQ